LHVAHVGGHPGLLPLPQALAALRERLRAPHADQIKARPARPPLQNEAHFGRVRSLRVALGHPYDPGYVMNSSRDLSGSRK
jgi:hypothetical protein